MVKEELKNKTGIFENGSGNVYRYVMMDPSVPLAPKTVYAYFCSFGDATRDTTEIFPSIDTICKDLNMNRKTVFAAINFLLERDLIIKNQRMIINPDSRPQMTSNEYKINISPKKFRPNDKAAVYSDSILDYKYGPISKKVMRDRNLKNWKSKCLYAYYCSFIGDNDYSKIDLSLVMHYLNIGKDAFYSMKKDIEGTYIKHVDIKDKRGVKTGGQRVFIIGVNASEGDFKEEADILPDAPEEKEEIPEKSYIRTLEKNEIPKDFLTRMDYDSLMSVNRLLLSATPDKEYYENRKTLIGQFTKSLYRIDRDYPSLGHLITKEFLRGVLDPAMVSYPIKNPDKYLLACLKNNFEN